MTSTTSFRLGDDQTSADSLMSDSDFEDFAHTEGSARSMDEFYWYGKRVFALLITEMVFDEADASTTDAELDFKYMMKMTDFPYAARLEYLVSLNFRGSQPLLRGNSNSFRNLMVFVGMVHSSGDIQTKQRLTTAMQAGSISPSNDQAEQHSPTPRPQSPLNGQATQQDPPRPRSHSFLEERHPEAGQDPDLPRYSIALKEHGDRRGYAIDWSTRQISISPLQFECRVTVRAMELRGIAGNKKLAKHYASLSACRSLGIGI